MLNINSCIIILNGIVQIALSIYDILVNEMEDIEVEDDEAVAGPDQGEEAPKATEEGNQDGQPENKKKENKNGIISILVNCSGF